MGHRLIPNEFYERNADYPLVLDTDTALCV